MTKQPNRRGFGLTLIVALCLAAGAVRAAAPQNVSPDKLLTEADIAVSSRRTVLLHQLHQIENRLTPAQRVHLAYLDAKQIDLAGHTTEAARRYKQILEHPIDTWNAVQARSALIALDLRVRNYLEAYTMANTLMATLPSITDPKIRTRVLFTLTRVAVAQKQYDQALDDAARMEASATTDVMRCRARVFYTQILIYRGGTLASTRPEYRKAIAMCRDAGVLLFTNSLRLDWADLLNSEGHPGRAIAYLHRIKPDILKLGFQLHNASLFLTLARAYLRQGRYDLARTAAHASLAENDPHSFNWTLEEAYRVLYLVEKHTGHPAAALSMHEKYLAQYKADTDNIKAQALAYQEVKQNVLAKRFKVEELNKQNRILQLRQALEHKAAETNRLYVVLLLVVIGLIMLWLYRIKHSQIHYRKLSRHDGLTGAFNRQHFLEQAELTLQRLRRTSSLACLLVLDMDHFKRVNDTFGHIAGDEVLRHAARICRAELRASDVFGRLGGEEFGILMPGCSPELGLEVGQRICRAMARSPARLESGDTVLVTSSIGITCTDTSGYVLKQLLIHADGALYEAKRCGRNRVSASADAPTDGQATPPLF